MNNFEFRREECKAIATEKVCDVFISNNQFYIFGLTEISEKILNYLLSKGKHVIGYISDDEMTSFLDIPIIQLIETNKKIPVINAALLRVYQSNKLLKRIGFSSVIDYFELNLMDEDIFKFPTIDNEIRDIETNFPKYLWLYELLEDKLSKDVLACVLDMRFNNQLSPLLKHNVSNQYFDVVANFKNIDVFVDCGGYHGETSEYFILKNPNYEKVCFFEPFPDAMSIAKNELIDRNVEFIQKGVYSSSGIFKLTSGREDGNAISLNGDISIETCTMDEEIKEQVDFIKLDIEGSELDALRGAENIIKKFQPIITVAIYHKQTHFWEIPQYIQSLIPECKIYMRHNNDGIYETILHVIPKRFYSNLSN